MKGGRKATEGAVSGTPIFSVILGLEKGEEWERNFPQPNPPVSSEWSRGKHPRPPPTIPKRQLVPACAGAEKNPIDRVSH